MFGRVHDVKGGSRQTVLAAALVALELISGMQIFLNQTILPIMAADLNAQNYYGVLSGTSSIFTLAALPIGAGLARRFRLKPLMLVLTVGMCAGAVVSAVAPTIGMYLAGLVIRAFASGCLATTTIGAAAIGLESRARQVTFALMSASWIISSIVGPVYAAWVTAALSWRWAMIIYLPLLLAGRWLIAASMRDDSREDRASLGIGGALLLGVGLALTILPVTGWPKTVCVVAGTVVLFYGAWRVLPPGTFALATPRHAAIGLYFGLVGAYFAVNAIVSLTAHDVLHVSTPGLGAIVMSGGLTWAVVGFLCGIRPAKTKLAFRVRASTGVALIAISEAGAGLWLYTANVIWHPVVVLGAFWGGAGIGMGLVYLDTINVMFTQPVEPDGLSMKTVAGANVMAESIASAIFSALATTWVATSYGASLSLITRHSTAYVASGILACLCFVPIAKIGAGRAILTSED